MLRTMIFIAMITSGLIAGDIIKNPKNCEKIVLSVKVDLVSCENLDYLVEYEIYDEKRGEVVKVTALTQRDARVIKSK